MRARLKKVGSGTDVEGGMDDGAQRQQHQHQQDQKGEEGEEEEEEVIVFDASHSPGLSLIATAVNTALMTVGLHRRKGRKEGGFRCVWGAR